MQAGALNVSLTDTFYLLHDSNFALDIIFVNKKSGVDEAVYLPSRNSQIEKQYLEFIKNLLFDALYTKRKQLFSDALISNIINI